MATANHGINLRQLNLQITLRTESDERDQMANLQS